MTLYRLFPLLALIAAASPVSAKLDSVPSLKIKNVSIAPTGRILMDAAAFTPDGNGLNAGAALPDIRLGAKATFGNWSANIDIGFGYGKLSMKDVYIRYDFNPRNNIRAGYFVHQFGLSSAVSSSFKPSMEAGASEDLFSGTDRNLGIQYIHDAPAWFASASAILSKASFTKHANEQGKVSYGGITRLVFRPWHADGIIGQIGWSGMLRSAEHDAVKGADGKTRPGDGYFKLSAKFPTRVCDTPMLGATVTHARHIFKMTPEWLLAYKRIAAEGQYYFMHISRQAGYEHYEAQGVYTLLRGVILGGDYGYNAATAKMADCGAKTLELVLGYNYTDAVDSHAGIFGGYTNDVSATLNYYFNKYVIARIGWRYVNVRNSAVQENRHVNIFAARISFKF